MREHSEGLEEESGSPAWQVTLTAFWLLSPLSPDAATKSLGSPGQQLWMPHGWDVRRDTWKTDNEKWMDGMAGPFCPLLPVDLAGSQ